MAAGDVKVELSSMDKQWIQAALSALKQVVTRKRNSEKVGSDVYNIRVRELQEIDTLINRFGG